MTTNHDNWMSDASWDKTDYSAPMPKAGTFNGTAYSGTSGEAVSTVAAALIGSVLAMLATWWM